MKFYTFKRTTMPFFSNKSKSHCHVRSTSLQARSHPSTFQLEQELNKLGTINTSSSLKAETILTGLSGLGELYKCIGELLSLPLTQRALTHHQHEKWVTELLEDSVRYIDICSNTSNIILLIKEALQQLQSALRRSRKVGNMGIELDVNAYICSRKKIKKEVTKSLAELKQTDTKLGASTFSGSDHHLSSVVRVLKEVSVITTSIFQPLLLFLSTPVGKPRPSRWSLVSKLVHKGVVGAGNYGQQNNLNEFEEVEIALCNFLFYCSRKDSGAERIQFIQGRLESLNSSIEGLESGLECLFRHLICTSVSLLNIVSH